MHPRITAVIISSVYLFGPMVFGAIPEQGSYFGSSPSELGENVFEDMVNGRGGPTTPLIPQDKLVFNDQMTSAFSGLGVEMFAPIVTVTKTYNHMRVANTVMPVIDPIVSSEYGWRTSPCPGCSSDHKGVDFTPGFGSPVFAVADGMVLHVGYTEPYGYYVVLTHLIANGAGIIEEWETLYAHLKKDSFPEELMIGSVVRAGETIGAVGNTGLSTGPHLHFELLINGEHVDPLPLLGTYEVLVVTEDEYPDYKFVGQTFKVVTTEITYE